MGTSTNMRVEHNFEFNVSNSRGLVALDSVLLCRKRAWAWTDDDVDAGGVLRACWDVCGIFSHV